MTKRQVVLSGRAGQSNALFGAREVGGRTVSWPLAAVLVSRRCVLELSR